MKKIPINTKHGMRYTRFYFRYYGMRARCLHKKAPDYHRYGGRGIKCLWQSFEEFKKDMYESFLEHAKVHGEKDTTLDRIDVNGNYYKGNCRWITMKEQNYNRRSSRMVTFKGKTLCLSQWVRLLDLNESVVGARLHRGWDEILALTTPVEHKYNKNKYNP